MLYVRPAPLDPARSFVTRHVNQTYSGFEEEIVFAMFDIFGNPASEDDMRDVEVYIAFSSPTAQAWRLFPASLQNGTYR